MLSKTVDKRLITILLIVLVQMIGASMVLPILPLYAQRVFEIPPEIITLLISTFFAAQFVAGPFLGRFSDRYGRVPVLIVSQLGTAVSFAMIAFAPSIAVLFLARLLDGITGGNIIVAQAYITDITEPENRTAALGYVFGMFGLGFVIGPAVGGILSAAFGLQVPFIIAAIAATFTMILTWFTLDETITPDKRKVKNDGTQRRSLTFSSVIRNYPLMLILTIGLVGQFGFGLLQGTFALYSEAVIFGDYSPQEASLGIGMILATIGLAQVLTQFFVLRRFVRWFGESRLVLMGTLIRGFTMFGFALISSVFLAIPLGMLFALGSGIMMPPLQSMATKTVDDRDRGGALGLYQSSVSLATILSTAIGGTLFAVDPTFPYWFGGVFFVLTAIPVLILIRWYRSHNLQVQPA